MNFLSRLTIRFQRLMILWILTVICARINADIVNSKTQCIYQTNDPGISFGCPNYQPSMLTWIKTGYYGMTSDQSQSNFCQNPFTSPATDCISDASGDRRLMAGSCNSFTNCLINSVDGKSYSQVVSSCSLSNAFPYVYVSYECLPRLQADNVSFINQVMMSSSSFTPVSGLFGKIYFWSPNYPSIYTNMQTIGCQIRVAPNTEVSIQVLDLYANLLDSTGACPCTFYVYSGTTGTYYQWCVAANWTDDSSAVRVMPSVVDAYQNIDIIFMKTYPNSQTQGVAWLLLDAVNVTNNLPANNISVYCGSSFTMQVLPTTTTTTSSTTTMPTTTTTSSTTTMITTTTSTTTIPTTTSTTTIPSTTTASTSSSTATTTTTTSSGSVMIPLLLSSSLATTTLTTVNNATTVESKDLGTDTMTIIIAVVVAAAVIIIIIVVVVCALQHCRNENGNKKDNFGSGWTDSESDKANNNKSLSVINAHDNYSVRSRDNIYDEIEDFGASPASPGRTATILRHPKDRRPSRGTMGMRVCFTAANDVGIAVFPGGTNISDDDKAMKQTTTTQSANEKHPRVLKDRKSNATRLTSVGQKETKLSKSDDDTTVQQNPVFGFRSDDIIMY